MAREKIKRSRVGNDSEMEEDSQVSVGKRDGAGQWQGTEEGSVHLPSL